MIGTPHTHLSVKKKKSKSNNDNTTTRSDNNSKHKHMNRRTNDTLILLATCEQPLETDLGLDTLQVSFNPLMWLLLMGLEAMLIWC